MKMGIMSEIDIALRNGDTALELAKWLMEYSAINNMINAIKAAELFIEEARDNGTYGRRD